MSSYIDLHNHSTFSCALTSGDALWLAGLLEGEAWFGERRGEGRVPRPQISLKMTDRDVVERVADLFGTSVTMIHSSDPRHKDAWVTRAVGKRAIEIMKQILPHMGQRRTETIEMLLWLYGDQVYGAKGVVLKSHCKRNHEFTDENTYIDARGSRHCRKCQRERERKYREQLY